MRSAAQADVYGLAKIAVDPADPNVPAAGLLQQYCVTCAVYWAHHKGSGGIEVPQDVARARDQAIEALRELRDGGRTLDLAVDPTGRLGGPTVVLSAKGLVTRRNFGSFC